MYDGSLYNDLEFIEYWSILPLAVFIIILIYSANSRVDTTINANKKDLSIIAISKNNEFKRIEGLKGRSSGSSIKNGIIYDYWKITAKDDKTYTIPKENEGLYNKVELNKSCFVTVNTDVTPNVILDVKYCN
jgi:hypothetical protein